jgi:lipopolysaccharide cholinephosphotransferase
MPLVRITQNQVNDLYDMFAHLVKNLNKYAIAWWVKGGTLLGAIRHKGIIPWDDDIDICIDKKDVPTLMWLEFIIAGKYTLKWASGKKYLKLKKDDLWIDIFIVDKGVFPQIHHQKSNFEYNKLFPLRKCMFGNIEVNIPNNAEEWLDKRFPTWRTEYIKYNHKDKKKHKTRELI